jgi:hypothetical protein
LVYAFRIVDYVKLKIAFILYVALTIGASAQSASPGAQDGGLGPPIGRIPASVICAWGIYLMVQAATAACGWARQTADDGIDQSIAAIDGYIDAHSQPSEDLVKAFKERMTGAVRADAKDTQLSTRICDSHQFAWLRSRAPDEILKSAETLLSSARVTPGLPPCLFFD